MNTGNEVNTVEALKLVWSLSSSSPPWASLLEAVVWLFHISVHVQSSRMFLAQLYKKYISVLWVQPRFLWDIETQVFHHLLQRKLTSRCSVTENRFEHPGSNTTEAQLTGRKTSWTSREKESSLSTLEIPAGEESVSLPWESEDVPSL